LVLNLFLNSKSRLPRIYFVNSRNDGLAVITRSKATKQSTLHASLRSRKAEAIHQTKFNKIISPILKKVLALDSIKK